MKNAFIKTLTDVFYDVTFKAKKHSPEILAGAGVAGMVVTVVTACKATTKVSKILEETKETVAQIHETAENPEFAEEYTAEDCKKDLAIVYTQTALKLVKLYAPTVIFGVSSVACMLASNNILHKRNVALTAAYAAIDTSFKNYRNAVIERVGEEFDKELRYNIKTEEVEETVVDKETGEETVVKKTIKTAQGPFNLSPYSVIFDETNDYYEKDASLNRVFLEGRERMANDMLRTKKRVFLNEVYELLGFEPTKAGQVVGWIYDPEDPNCDSFIDFGMYTDLYENTSRGERQRAFMNGYERAIILDFNVQGNVWENW